MERVQKWFWMQACLVPLVNSCGHTLFLSSTPSGANVYYLSVNGERLSVAGQTPLTLKQPKDGGRRYFLEVDKTGFVPKSLFIEQSHPLGSDSIVSVSLKEQDKEWFYSSFSGSFSVQASQLINFFLELRSRITDNDVESVKKIEKQMNARYARFSTFNALLGEFYVKQGNIATAKKFLSRAIEVNPQDVDSRILLERLNQAPKK